MTSSLEKVGDKRKVINGVVEAFDKDIGKMKVSKDLNVEVERKKMPPRVVGDPNACEICGTVPLRGAQICSHCGFRLDIDNPNPNPYLRVADDEVDSLGQKVTVHPNQETERLQVEVAIGFITRMKSLVLDSEMIRTDREYERWERDYESTIEEAEKFANGLADDDRDQFEQAMRI